MATKGKYVYDWPRPMVTVDAAVFNLSHGKAKLLLIKRGNEPFKGRWALPGGFVELDEELEDAAARELAEETGIENVPLEQMRTYGACGRDPRGRQITIVYLGIITSTKTKLTAGDDASQAKWFDINELPAEVSFDHDHIIKHAVTKLKRKKIFKLNTKK